METFSVIALSYVLFVRKNALQVLIPKFGLEGTIYVSGKKDQGKKFAVEFVYNEEVSTFFLEPKRNTSILDISYQICNVS